MAPRYTLISKLTSKNNKASLHVRVTHIWEVTQKQQKKKTLFHTDVLFIDKKVSSTATTRLMQTILKYLYHTSC